MAWLHRWHPCCQRDLRLRFAEAEVLANRAVAFGGEPKKGSGALTAAKEGDLSGEYIARVVLHCQIPKLPYFRRTK